MRVAIVGVGNEMRGDDGIGIRLARELKKELKGDCLIIDTQVPENFIKPILDFGPRKVVILDSADFKGKPGDFRTIKQEEILEFLISTHNMPLTVLFKALENLKARKILIGVQPENLNFGEGISRELEGRVPEILAFIRTLL